MIYEHQFGSITKHYDSTITVAFDFTNDLATGETLVDRQIAATDEGGSTVTGTIVNSHSVTHPKVYVTLTAGTQNESYEIKIVAVTSAGHAITRFVVLDVVGDIPYNTKLGDFDANSYVTLEEANKYIKSNFYHPDQWDNLTFEGRRRLLIQAAKDIDALNYKGKQYYESQTMAFPRSDHETYEGNASINVATKFVVRGANLFSSAYNEIPDNYFKNGTVHIDRGDNFRQTRYIDSSTASKGGGYGEVVLASPFDSNVVNTDHYIVFKPLYQDVKDAQCEQAMHIIANEFYKYADYTYAKIGYARTGDLGLSFKDADSTIPGAKICFKARRLLGRYVRKSIKYGRS